MGSKNNDAQIEALNKGIEEQKKARERIDSVESPDYDQIKQYIEQAAAENPQLLGLLQEIEQDPSALEDITSDPSLRDTQVKALESLKEAGESGFSEADMAERRELSRDVEAGESARQSSILQQMAQRGQSGSGTELAARLSSSQAATQRAAEATDRLATDSAAARRQALLQASQAAGSLRSQDRSEQTELASARDQIAQFNAMNRQNIGNQNLGLRQGMENQRSAQQQNKYNQLGNLQQQQFANDMKKAGAYAQATAPIAQMQTQNYRQSQGPMGAIGSLAGAGLGAYFGGSQGAAVGAQLGGAVGNATQSNRAAYADGGIAGPNRDYSEIMRDKKLSQDIERDVKFGGDRYQQALMGGPNISTEEAYSAGKQKLGEIGDSLKGLLGRNSVPEPTSTPTEVPSKDSEMMGSMSALAEALNKKEAPREQMRGATSVPMQSMDVDAMRSRKLIAADGGPKYGGITDAQADQLKAELAAMDRKYADGGMKSMAYNDGGEGTIIDSGEEMYAGDQLEDRINDGELVLNLEQQDRINDKLMELKRLKSLKRTDTMVDEGEKEANRNQQEALMSVARGDMEVEELPNDRVVKEPTGGMGELMALLSKSKRR